MALVVKAVDKEAIAGAFGRAAAKYDTVAKLQQQTGEYLMGLAQAEDIGMRVLDAGCGTGFFSARWKQQGKQVIALDLASGMLGQAKGQHVADYYLQGDIEHLGLADNSVDICFSNLVVQWCNDLSCALREFYRVTRPGGLIVFSTLAQGSLNELATAWARVDDYRHINQFLPLQIIIQACQPYRHKVIDRKYYQRYPQLLPLLNSLKGIGATHLHHGRQQGLMTRKRLNTLAEAYPRNNGDYPLSYQIVFGVIYCDK
ncbi:MULTISPECIES: malonyl-ACP O-methyltransferase BioC [Xenorhabdus]|uniref:Malonyl-[acyl-carrier protein] O-methyltransferase n=1 Tax=Xenorhabdus ehlersii TaxID=290111 RepID=A0A2D0IY31_9GAMM|nr:MULTISPECIES: malonyl-ACP O-methyltransferase BioC [Xenorhabdus]MBC8947831.1 methyltransferase [Xenorhabdus sp. TS4]MBC8948767.1 methyltransferase [Xenorhabdus sp. TS4]PHM25283.1 methyltransferase [Xenorhabdus ehlersii]PHM26860.1 methyltransferase [Xenorhabdus ehlersii]RKE90414.1 pimeloyl-CoA biosynthesis protein BioC [Xenorhabdus ehlersii]